MRSVSFSLAALVSAAVALPLDPHFLTYKKDTTVNTSVRREITKGSGYVDAATALALCDTVNSLTEIIQSSDIGIGFKAGFLQCDTLPVKTRDCDGEEHSVSSISSSSHDPHHDAHSGNVSPPDNHRHSDKGEVFDHNPGKLQAVHPVSHQPQATSSGGSDGGVDPYGTPSITHGGDNPLLGVSAHLEDAFEPLEGVVRAVLNTPGSGPSTDSVKDAVESAVGSATSSAGGAAGPLIHLAFSNTGALGDLGHTIGGVSGATDPGLSGPASNLAGGGVSTSKALSGDAMNPITGAITPVTNDLLHLGVNNSANRADLGNAAETATGQTTGDLVRGTTTSTGGPANGQTVSSATNPVKGLLHIAAGNSAKGPDAVPPVNAASLVGGQAISPASVTESTGHLLHIGANNNGHDSTVSNVADQVDPADLPSDKGPSATDGGLLHIGAKNEANNRNAHGSTADPSTVNPIGSTGKVVDTVVAGTHPISGASSSSDKLLHVAAHNEGGHVAPDGYDKTSTHRVVGDTTDSIDRVTSGSSRARPDGLEAAAHVHDDTNASNGGGFGGIGGVMLS